MTEGIPANFLIDGITHKTHLTVLNFHRRMYYELTYARRQILIAIQAIFGKFPDGNQQQELHWAGPDNIEGEDFGQFLWSKESLKVEKWSRAYAGRLDYMNKMIHFENKKIHCGQYPLPRLNNNQRKAKYLEFAAAGFAEVNKKIIENGNNLFNRYVKECKSCPELLDSVGQDFYIKEAALGIWFSKTRKLLARVKKVLDLKSWLLRVADVFYDQLENEPLKKRLRRVLSRAYFRLYSTPDQVPVNDLANLTWKLFGFELERHQVTLENKKKVWFDPKQLNEAPMFIKGRLDDLPKRRTGITAEEVGEPPISEEAEPGEDQVPDTKHKLNSDIYYLLKCLHIELIWGRRQIMLVIQLFFGDLEQGKYEWPDEADGGKFVVESRENLRVDQWIKSVRTNFKEVLNLWSQKQFIVKPVGEVPFDKMPLNYQQSLYVDVALAGIDHFRRLLVKAWDLFYTLQTECLTLLNAMPEDSPEQQEKHKKVTELINERSLMLTIIRTTLDEGSEKLVEMAKQLKVTNGQVDEIDLKSILNDIYFKFYPLTDNQLPTTTKLFCVVAYQMFGWNWTFEVKKDKPKDIMTLFEKPPHNIRIRRYKGIVLEGAGKAPDGASKGGEEPEEEGAAGKREIEDAERDEQEKRAQTQAAIGREVQAQAAIEQGVQAQGGGEGAPGASVGAQGEGQVVARGRGKAKGRAKPRESGSGAAGGLQ